MSRRALPLNALRGFDAAARHLSFSLAAQELNVTQGAVSRQIRSLEDALGLPLFRRLTRRIELTSAGEEFYHAVQDALSGLEEASRRLQKASTQTIVVSILPTLATIWLMPRLHRFVEDHRNIEVRIVASIDPPSLEGRGIDVAIRVGQMPGHKSYNRLQPRMALHMLHNWNGINADELFPDTLMPICSKNLISKSCPIASPKDLLAYPLIHNSTRRNAWPDWLKANGVPPSEDSKIHLEFGHFFMVIDAAVSGQGIALIPSILLLHHPFASALITPLSSLVPSAGEYHLLIHESRLRNSAVQAFRSWVKNEAKQTKQELEALEKRLF